MLFNSLGFAVFLPVVFTIYWSLQKAPLRYQNLFLLIASYVFYGWWDVRFLLLLFVSSLCDYVIGYLLAGTADRRKRKNLLAVSLVVNLVLLGFFKYFNFFIDSASSLLRDLGLHHGFNTLNIILPVGISFYTFQTLSYTIDVYRGKVKPTRDFIAFFSFVSFFPQLVAGPVERARNLLPQFHIRRSFDPRKASDGMRQILWGLVKKIVIADNIGRIVDAIFFNYMTESSLGLALGGVFFLVQIYCDFSGYTDIAIGSARLFGFDLMRNFAFPLFSRNLSEFWSRWNISVSSWFRDYIYGTLRKKTDSRARRARNILVTFTASGLWHGANWTFLCWGFCHGVLFSLALASGHGTRYDTIAGGRRLLPRWRELGRMLLVFLTVSATLVMFRVKSMEIALEYYGNAICFWSSGFTYKGSYTASLILMGALLGIEWLQRNRKHALEIDFLPKPLRWVIYDACLFAILVLGDLSGHQFIYFQF